MRLSKRFSHDLRSLKKKRHLNANICGQKKDGLSKVDLHLFIRNRLTFIDLGSVFTENAF